LVKYPNIFTFSFSCGHGLQDKVALNLNTKVNIIQACVKTADSKTNHSKSNVGKTQVYDISKIKLEVGKYWLNCCNGSIEWKIMKTGNKDINEIVEWFVHVRATELPIPETTV
jgi:hypothetical protein